MPLFETAIQQQSSVGSVASLIFDTDNTSTTTYGPLGSIAVGTVLTNISIMNTGSNTIYVGMGSASAAATTGMQIPAAGQLTLRGYNVTSVASNATGDIWANCTTGNTSSVVVGMVTTPEGV